MGAMSGIVPNAVGLIIIAFGDMIRLFIQVMTGALFLYVIMSWIQPFSPIQRLLQQIVMPIVGPFQRIIPPVAGFDLSIIPAFIALQLLTIVLVTPLVQWGMGIAFG
jgi:YggT family protein